MIALSPLANRAFFGPLFQATPVFASGEIATIPAGDPATEAWARKIVVDQLAALGFAKPPLGMVQIAQAVGRLEGHYGRAKNPPQWAGSNNWGAVLCCLAKDGVCPDNTFKATDSSPTVGNYDGCFKKYPTPEAGCLDMLRIATKTPAEKAAFMKADVVAVSTAMYDAHYYTGTTKDREKAIAYHVASITRNVKAIASALGEPVAIGGEVSPTDSGSNALLLLIPIALGVLAKVGDSSGDPIIVSRSDAWDKIIEVNGKFDATDDEMGRTHVRQKLSPQVLQNWRTLYNRWSNWYRMKADSGINNLSAQNDYSEAQGYDKERYGYALLIEKAVPNDRPPELKPPDPKDPNAPGLLSDFKDVGMAVAAVAIVVTVANAIRRLYTWHPLPHLRSISPTTSNSRPAWDRPRFSCAEFATTGKLFSFT